MWYDEIQLDFQLFCEFQEALDKLAIKDKIKFVENRIQGRYLADKAVICSFVCFYMISRQAAAVSARADTCRAAHSKRILEGEE